MIHHLPVLVNVLSSATPPEQLDHLQHGDTRSAPYHRMRLLERKSPCSGWALLPRRCVLGLVGRFDITTKARAEFRAFLLL